MAQPHILSVNTTNDREMIGLPSLTNDFANEKNETSAEGLTNSAHSLSVKSELTSGSFSAIGSIAHLGWRNTVLAIWAFVVVLSCTNSFRHHLEIRRLIRRSFLAADDVCRLAREVSDEIDFQRSLKVLVSTEIGSPCVVSALHNIIVLTPEVVDATRVELKGILAHEISHLRSRDVLWSRAFHCLAIVGWFHPLCWKISKSHMQAFDERCDFSAAYLLGNAMLYAKTLARLALTIRADFIGKTPESRYVLSMAGSSAIVKHVRLLRTDNWNRSTSRLGICVTVSAIVLLTAFGFVAITRSETPREISNNNIQPLDVSERDLPPDELLQKLRDRNQLSEIYVLVAKHVVLYRVNNGRQRIGQWDDVYNLLEKAPGIIHLTIGATWSAVADKGRNEQIKAAEERYLQLSRKFGRDKYTGMVSKRSVGRVKSEKFDRIHSAKDLRPDPKLRRTAQVVDQTGNPVSDAEVVLVYGSPLTTKHGIEPFRFHIKDGKLRNPDKHIVSTTKLNGEFSYYRPPTGNYSLLIFHPKGFKHVASSAHANAHSIAIANWAKVNVKISRDDEHKAQFPISSLTVDLETPRLWPEIKLHYYDAIPTDAGHYEHNNVAPGRVTVFRSLKPEQHRVGVSSPTERFTLGEGESKSVSIVIDEAFLREMRADEKAFEDFPPKGTTPK